MNHHQSKMNHAVKKKARSFTTMGAGFVDQMETMKMEERLQLMKRTMEQEREERKNRGGQFWKSGQRGKLTTYATTVLQSKLSNKKIGKVKMLTEEQLNLPNRNEATSLSKKLSDISNNSTNNFKPSTKNDVRLCGQCESNGAALCCIQCTEVYCTACFSAYHKKGALRKHRSISLEVSSAPRSKPPSCNKRLFDLALYPMAADTTSLQSDSPSPSVSGVLKKDEEEASMSTLMDGNYNEVNSAASFQQALLAWRTGKQTSAAAGAAAVTPKGAATSVASAKGNLSSKPKPHKNEGIDSSTSTMDTASLASLMDKKQNHTLSYAERLLLKRNRRTPIYGKKEPLDATEPSEIMDNSEQIKTEKTSSVIDSAETPGRLSADEPVTFSSLYRLVDQETKESDESSFHKEETLAGPSENNELTQEAKVSKSPTENFPQQSSISVTPVVVSFPEKHPSSSASQSDEKVKIQSTSSHQSVKKPPTSQDQRSSQTPRKPTHTPRRSSGVFQATNLTSAPSEGLQMVCQLSKSQHRHNDGEQPSILMAGLSSDAFDNTDELHLSGRGTPLVSKSGVHRPATTVRVSYTFYKMSPRSWHPEDSIIRNLSDYQFHRSGSLSDKLKLGENDTESNPTSVEVQRASEFNHPENTIETTSSTLDESAMMEDTEGDLSAMSSDNQDLERSSTSPRGASGDTPQTMMDLNHILAYYNNNAISDHAERYDPISPNSITEETVFPILIDSTTPVHFCRSKTMSPITTIHAANRDHQDTPIHSARSTPRNKSTPPDLSIEKQKYGFSKPVHSMIPPPISKTISPIPSEISSEEKDSAVLSLKASATSLHSVTDNKMDNIECPLTAINDAPENLSDTPILSARNTPRSNTMPSIPMIKERQLDRTVTPSSSIRSTPRSKTMSTIHILQETQKRCDTPVYSVKGTPRYESMTPIPTVLETQVKSSDTPSHTKIDTEERISGTLVSPSKSLPRSKSTSPISNIPENICGTSVDSLRCSPSSKAASSIATMIEFQENDSATSVCSLKGTPRNKSESPIPTLIDTQESISDTPIFPIPSIIEKQLNCSVTPVPSTTDTPRTQKSDVTTSQTKGSPISNHEDENQEETLQYNAKVYQMLINKELECCTPEPEDHIVPLLPTATDRNKNTVDLEEPSETTTTTETDPNSSDCIPITSGSATPHCSSTTGSSESETPVDSGREKLPIHDKLATPFYMCNSELYDADSSSVQGLESAPPHANAKLKKSSASTTKYIIRRPPEIPDGTLLQKSNSPKDENLQSKSASPTLSVLEMKRIHFKQANNDQNVISLEEKPNRKQSNLVSDFSRSSPSLSEDVDCSVEVEAEDDLESVFSSLTKMSMDSLDEQQSQSLMFTGDEFLTSDDLQAEIDEIEEQIAEEIKVKALK